PIIPPASFFFIMLPLPPTSTLFPYTTLFRSRRPCRNRRARAFLFPLGRPRACGREKAAARRRAPTPHPTPAGRRLPCFAPRRPRSEEHTSELQSRSDLVCRLLLEKKKNNKLI